MLLVFVGVCGVGFVNSGVGGCILWLRIVA